jgi:hypothetical protein
MNSGVIDMFGVIHYDNSVFIPHLPSFLLSDKKQVGFFHFYPNFLSQ